MKHHRRNVMKELRRIDEGDLSPLWKATKEVEKEVKRKWASARVEKRRIQRERNNQHDVDQPREEEVA